MTTRDDRMAKHERRAGWAARRLRAMGLHVATAPRCCGFDFLVNGRVRVAVRVAFPVVKRHCVRTGGRAYTYRYASWLFNFHHHGKVGDRYADFLVCVAEGAGRVFVIPWEAVSGKTFSLHGGRGRYRGRYAPFLNRWEAVAGAAEARAAG